ncbi:MAG: ribose-phosphate pyrophosphokinase [Verrucomicrobia bacterium]|nr:ribose-phosphate pyrophosphokinase [Verrucomicrobiota bacterium]
MSRTSVLIAGTSHALLAEEVARQLGISLFPVSIVRFPDGECRVQLNESVTGKQVFILQSLARAPNERLVEALLLVDAARRGGAQSIVLVCPYLAYSRQSVQETEGVSVAARLFADFLKIAGVNHLVTIDLHAELVRSFFDFPVEHLSARSAFIEALQVQKIVKDDLVVVGPDLGSAKLASKLSQELGVHLALIQKQRIDAHKVNMLSLLGDVKGKTVLLADDVCSTAGTLTSAATVCREKGAKNIFACVSHGLFSEEALDLIEKSPIERLFVSDSVRPEHRTATSTKICVVSIANTLAFALSRLRSSF